MKTIKEPIQKGVEAEQLYALPCQNIKCQAVLEISNLELRQGMNSRGRFINSFHCPYCKWVSEFDDCLLSTYRSEGKT